MSKDAIRVEHLTKHYPDFTLDDINFTVPTGSIVGFVGENGAGKTTTIKSILGIIQSEGNVEILGMDAHEQEQEMKEQIGVVFDENHFHECFKAKQIDTIMKQMYRNWDTALFTQYLRTFQLPSGKTIKEFSRGMKMKLAIAVALAHHPKLLVLDEATSGLDPVVRDEVLDLLYDFMQDETHAVLLSSHITSDLDKIADNITFIHHGRVLLSEGRDELIDRHGVLRCTEEQLNALDPDAVRAVRKGAFGCEALVKRDGIPENWPVEPVSVEQIMMFLTKGEEVR